MSPPRQLPLATVRACVTRDLWRRAQWGVIALWLAALWLAVVWAGGAAGAEVELPIVDVNLAIRVASPQAHRWQQGGYDMWLLQGGVTIEQGHLQKIATPAVTVLNSSLCENPYPSSRKMVGKKIYKLRL